MTCRFEKRDHAMPVPSDTTRAGNEDEIRHEPIVKGILRLTAQ
jgi:hypothetical protein